MESSISATNQEQVLTSASSMYNPEHASEGVTELAFNESQLTEMPSPEAALGRIGGFARQSREESEFSSPLSSLPPSPPSTSPMTRDLEMAAAQSEKKKRRKTTNVTSKQDVSARTRRKRAKKASGVEPGSRDVEAEVREENATGTQVDESTRDATVSARPKRKRKNAINAKVETEAETNQGDDDEVSPPKKPRKRRRKTPEEDRIYEIAPIESVLPTSFKGRLGYACMNTILRKRSPPVFCARTCRIDTINKPEMGIPYVKSLALQNLKDLKELVLWNEANGIKFMRMSSEMFPFASHEFYGYDLADFDELLKEVGELARRLGHRLTSHPGQYTQLSSPREAVVKSSVRELEYHCEIMDRMGLDKNSVMIIHMGGTYGDKATTLERFKTNYATLSDRIKERLVLENDELCYNVDDLLPICQELNIPLVFDYHHDWIYPSTRPAPELIPLINETWYRKGIKPKQHCSEPRPGAVSVMEKRAHSDRVKKLPEGLPDDMDLMLECKDKEQAVLYLYRLYNLFPVDQKVLRPPAEVETMQTAGRKGIKRKKAKIDVDAGEVEPEDCKDEEMDMDNKVEMRGTEEEKEEGILSDCGSVEDPAEVLEEDNEPVSPETGRPKRSKARKGKKVETRKSPHSLKRRSLKVE